MSSNLTARGRLRRSHLGSVVQPSRLTSTWRDVVRKGMRKQDVLDLHDYQDFHRHLTARLQALSAAVLSSDYRPGRTQTVRLEKSHGICRKLIIPTPEDAVLVQALVDTIARPF
jgi:hypothetical protein